MMLAGSSASADPAEGQADCRRDPDGTPSVNLDTEKEILAHLSRSPYAQEKGCFPESKRKTRKLDKNGCWYTKYDDYVDEMIPSDSPFLKAGAPPDIAEACPNYATMGTKDKAERAERRRAFWSYVLQAVSAAESDFKTNVHLLEEFRYDGAKKVEVGYPGYDALPPVYSEGLFQVSKASCHNSGGKKKSLLEARNNIQCAVDGLRRQLFEKDGSVREEGGLFSRGSQWAVLQRKKNLDAVDDCLRKIPGSKNANVSKVDPKYAGNIAGCRGLSGRKVLSQFWEGYPWGKPRGMNLCGLKNHFPFCGELKCAKLPEKKKRK